MKRTVKIIVCVLIAVSAVAGIVWQSKAPLETETVTAELTTAKITFTEQGSYAYDRSVDVYSQISGEVLEVKVKQGQRVKKGDVIAVVSASDYEYQIKSLESSIAGYQAQISDLSLQERSSKDSLANARANLVAQLEQAESNLKNFESSQKSLEKQIELQNDIIEQNSHIISIARSNLRELRDSGAYDYEINAARTAYTQAQNALDQSRQQLAQLEAGITDKDSAEAQRDSINSQIELIDQQMGRNNIWAMQQYYGAMIESTEQTIESMREKLGQSNISAPIDGVIERLPVADSNLISPQSSAATIGTSPVVEVYVPIREIDGVKTGNRVELILDKRLGNETISGTVIEIWDEAEIKVSALGVEERKVRVLILPSQNVLNIGYSMDVRFTVFSKDNAIVVPKTAVFETDGSDSVWTVENGEARLRGIEIGVETRVGYEIVSGLSVGDIVISDANTEGLKEGKRIE